MMRYPFYTPNAAQVDDLLRSAPAGRLITTAADGSVDVGLYPFIGDAATIEVHLNAGDPQLRALRAGAGCLFVVDELLSRIPSHWMHPETATYADLYYRTVTLRGTAQIVDDAGELAVHLDTLLARHQAPGSHVPVGSDPARYAGAIGRIRLVRIAVSEVVAKFKLGQQEPLEVRLRIIEALRARGTELDLATAAHAEAMMD
jgi:predicted FMN-binding regulatory protein PaiB